MSATPAVGTAPTTLSDRIRQATMPMHKRAEHAEFQQRLVAGKHGPAPYGAWLGQMLLLHGALERLEEAGVRAAGATQWPIERGHYKTDELHADLATVGVDATAVAPLPATRTFIERCESWARDPEEAWRLLGVWYVLEGATNGGRYIARNVRRGAGVGESEGTRYLDPYGEEQPVRWAAFKAALNAAVPAAHADKVLAGACDTYDAVTAMGEELSREHPAA
jgi:heme oxygenase